MDKNLSTEVPHTDEQNKEEILKITNIKLGLASVSKEEAIKVYKKVKKEYLLTQAEKYKELFPKDVYEKIINYKIEIKKYEDAKL